MLSLLISDQPQPQGINLAGLKEKATLKEDLMRKTSKVSASAARTRTTSNATWITSRMTTCSATMAKRGHPCVAKPRIRRDQSSSSSIDDTSTKSDDSLGPENLLSVPKELNTERDSTTTQDEISPESSSRKCPTEVKSATVHVLLPPLLPEAAASNPAERETLDEASAPGSGLSEERKPEDPAPLEAGASPLGMEEEQSEASSSLSAGRSAATQELARTTWVLFPNGKYQIFVDYPNGVRMTFLSAPGAIYKPGPHLFFVPTGGEISRHGLVVPQDMVHLMLPLGVAVPQQQKCSSPLAVQVIPSVV